MPVHWSLWVAKVAGLVPVELCLLWGEPFMEERKCSDTIVHVVVGSQSRKYDSVPESVFKYLSFNKPSVS